MIDINTTSRKISGLSARQRETGSAWLMLSPSVILYVLFIGVPLIAAIVLSFYNWDLLGSPQFTGLHNFNALAHDSGTLRALGNTFYFAIVTVVIHLVGALVLAMAINRPMNWLARKLATAAIFFPAMISWAAVSLTWRYILDPNYGFVTYYLKQIGITPPNWFLNTSTAMPALIGIDVWHSLGYTMVIILAGLQGIPSNLYEAARMDGAGALRQFWSITIPMLSPTLLFASIISFIGAFQIFDPMFIITQGGPDNSTKSIVEDVYNTAFQDFNMGYASAKSLIIVAVILAISLLQIRLSRRWVNYDK